MTTLGMLRTALEGIVLTLAAYLALIALAGCAPVGSGELVPCDTDLECETLNPEVRE